MDDLIPFLIVIAISIVGSAMRKKRKRDAAGNSTPSPQNKKSDDIFSWMEKFTNPEESVNPYQQNVEEENMPSSEKPQQITIREHLTQKAAKESAKSLVNELKESSYKQKSENSSSASNFTSPVKLQAKRVKNKQQFNLKKAVIYSEILNRKYY